QAIEKATNKKIEMMELPSTDLINNRRIEKFKQRITDTLADKQLGLFKDLIEQYQQESEIPLNDIAAALAKMIQGEAPFLLQNKPNRKTPDKSWDRDDNDRNDYKEDRKPRRERGDRERGDRERAPEQGMQRFRIEVGHDHEVKPGNIVGAIANEADIDSKYIGRINIFDDHSLVDLPEGMPKELFSALKKVRVMGQALNISQIGKNAPRTVTKENPRKDKPQKVRVKKRARDKDKGKPKRARSRDSR
ncbi:MAG: ATP-dependent helicase, partial [Aestuariibacter sp.]|nr:ATP-dependent helicase [Aestuariibacter sp.]